MMMNDDWEEMTDILTPEGVKKLKKGQILAFDFEGSRNEYKIMRIKQGRVWVKPITTYTREEAKQILDKEEAKFTDEGLDPRTTQVMTDEELENE